ncbi:MAG: zinc dependent phospholipase C family protein [Lachnospiraceae bacterium]|nr:zinc dependent phospholipase C family protein [Lachnospiraceae bacterium]
MPAFYTHLSYGMGLFHNLDSKYLKRIIRSHYNAYRLGTSGPDIFFYDVVSVGKPGMSQGERMHRTRTGLFIKNLLEQQNGLTGENRETAIAYTAGFLTHYLLDCAMHPHVYSRIDAREGSKQKGEHFKLEAALDAYFSRKYLRRYPSLMKQLPLVYLGREERKTVEKILTEAYRKTYPESKLGRNQLKRIMASVYTVMILIDDPYGVKELALGGLEKVILGHPFCSPLFVNNNTYDCSEELWRVFDPVFSEALVEGERVLNALGHWAELVGMSENASADLEKQLLLLMLGNRSYHTGKECERQ